MNADRMARKVVRTRFTRYVGVMLLSASILGASGVSVDVLGFQPDLPQISLEKTAVESEAGVRDTIHYQIMIQNTGTTTAGQLTIVDRYDPQMIVAIGNTNPGASVDDSAGEIIWELADLEPDQEALLTYEATLGDILEEPTSHVENTASVLSDGTSIGTVIHRVSIKISELAVSKEREDSPIVDLNDDGLPSPGDTIQYAVEYQNSGTAAATNVTLVDDYDERFVQSIGKITAGGADNGDTIVWNLGTVLAGAGERLTYEVVLESNIEPGSHQIANHVAINSDELIGKEASNILEIQVPATPTPEPTETPRDSGVINFTAGDTFLKRLMVSLVFLLIVVALLVLAVISIKGDFTQEQRAKLVRVGLVVIIVVGAVLLMALFTAIDEGAAAGILGTVAGYLLRESKG